MIDKKFEKENKKKKWKKILKKVKNRFKFDKILLYVSLNLFYLFSSVIQRLRLYLVLKKFKGKYKRKKKKSKRNIKNRFKVNKLF